MTPPISELIRDQEALRGSAGATRLPRDVIRVTGPDASSYLQGQLSQDVTGLAPGESRWALVLAPDGKVDAWMRVWGRDGDELLLDVDAGAGQVLLDRLNRFKLRVAVELELMRWDLVAVRGPAAPGTTALDAELVGEVDWAGIPGVDLLGASVHLPEGVPEVSAAALDVLRIEAGRPAMGSELGPDLEPRVIPAEAGQWLIDESVSFTKGCYTGQELVARVDSRGSNTPRKLRGIVIGDAEPPRGAEVRVEDQVRGTLTSVGWSAARSACVALAYVHRSVEPGSAATVSWAADGTEVTAAAEVHELPLLGG